MTPALKEQPFPPTELRLSLSGERVEPILASNFSAVGLIRSEYLMRRYDEYITLPSCQQLIQSYVAQVAEVFAPKAVWYRTSELWSDEANTLSGNDLDLREKNPMVGLRGIRRAMRSPATFEIEVRLLAEVARQHGNLHVMIPFVGDADEFGRAVSILNMVGWPNRVGSMLEIPSAVLEADRFVSEGATNLLLGLNDLTCLLRGAERASGFDDKSHRSVWWCVEHVRESVGQACEWGIAGSLSRALFERALRCHVPYVSVHYCDLAEVCTMSGDILPDADLVRITKVKTRSRIAAYDRARNQSKLAENAKA